MCVCVWFISHVIHLLLLSAGSKNENLKLEQNYFGKSDERVEVALYAMMSVSRSFFSSSLIMY